MFVRNGLVALGVAVVALGGVAPVAVAQSTERVSLDSAGTQGDANSFSPSISDDGRYVAFRSAATNLVAGDTNGVRDVFVRDRDSGVTVRVSVASDGTQADGQSEDAAISADGRHVAFVSLRDEPRRERHQRREGRVRARPRHGHHRARQRRQHRRPEQRRQLHSVDQRRRTLRRV